MNKSIATINSPEFINLKPLDINPLMSECEIKVLYLGENRNHSYITKEVATEMAKTLRGAPIVGYYKTEKEDFADHGERVVIDDEGIKFECLTKPFGFVSPVAEVWFQKFDDTDKFGNITTREYLMTTGYLWTGQYEECKCAIEGEGKPQSMELDEKTLKGSWETNQKTGMDFFIINDATFTKLCILGDDVEPCFEGAKVSNPEISSTFSKVVDDKFKKTLFTMIQELKPVLNGGQKMENEKNLDNIQNPTTDFTAQDPSAANVAPENNFAKKDDENAKDNTDANENKDTKNDDKTQEDDKKDPETKNACGGDGNKDPETKNACGGKDGEDKKDPEVKNACGEDKTPAAKHMVEEEKYNLLEAENKELQDKYSSLEAQYNELSTQYQELVNFKAQIEEAEKDEMINKFSMLTDEEKADVIANKAKYTVEDIENKLSVICVKKQGIFNSKNNDKIDNNMHGKNCTFSLDDVQTPSEPAWLQALKKNRK